MIVACILVGQFFKLFQRFGRVQLTVGYNAKSCFKLFLCSFRDDGFLMAKPSCGRHNRAMVVVSTFEIRILSGG
jgi:hypothetical protein